jgi:hypothetical protein
VRLYRAALGRWRLLSRWGMSGAMMSAACPGEAVARFWYLHHGEGVVEFWKLQFPVEHDSRELNENARFLEFSCEKSIKT